MEFGHYSAEQLRNNINGKNGEGYAFVALDEQNKVVGTSSLRIDYVNKWWHKGRCGYRCETAILPEYRGTDVYLNLREILNKKEKELKLSVTMAKTSEMNDVVIKINKKLGWKFVEYLPTPWRSDYYSYCFVKWKDGCPYKDWKINLMFKLTKFYVRTVYVYNGTRKVNRFTHWIHKDR